MNISIKEALTWQTVNAYYRQIISASRVEHLHRFNILMIITPTVDYYYDLGNICWSIMEEHIKKNLPNIREVQILCLDRPSEPLCCSIE
jgi:hypothetical protein